MYEHTALTAQTPVDEVVGGWEVLEQILVFQIIDVQDHMRVGGEDILVRRHGHDGEHMCDVGFPKSRLTMHTNEP